MKLAVTSNAIAYADTIKLYADETGKTLPEALAREGPDFKLELYRQFRAIQPTPLGSIFAAAKSRGWRVARKNGSQLVGVAGGVSARALSRARELLHGQKSELFRFTGTAIAGFGLAPVRFSARGGNKLLQGGRTGWRFAKSALAAYQLPAKVLREKRANDSLKSYGVRRLNLRALAVHYELLYRERAAQGGTMAVQWMFQTWRKGSRMKGRASQLMQRSTTGVPIGTVDFEFGTDGELSAIIFNGYVPGTGVQADKRGLVDNVFAARTPRLLKAIQMSHDKVARQKSLAA
jgi:hypothetical protein